jgi:2-polyprenyl-3-methyl-5-hydroxy-6-metoxy-1,4-benzoquinol methylase
MALKHDKNQETPMHAAQLQTPEQTSIEEWSPDGYGERVVEGINYGWLMRDHIARYHFAAPYCTGKRVLDVATGTGYGANILCQAGATEVVAVDREQRALDYAAHRYGTDRLRWVNGDAYDLNLPRDFEVVVSFETIEHLKDPERFVVECKRVLKTGGLFIVSTPENVGGPFVSVHHELEFTRAEFRDLLGRHFSSVELLGQRRELTLPIRPLGALPDRYLHERIYRGRGSQGLFKLMDRINKAPSHVLAWAAGFDESFRNQIRPIDAPIKKSAFLKPHYFAMIGLCRNADVP